MTVEADSDELPPSLARELGLLGVAPPQRKKNAPVKWPEPRKKPMASQGWKPSYPGEEPPW